MADIKSRSFRPTLNPHAKGGKSNANPLFLREEVVRQGIELLFYAYRDFIAEPDEVLESQGLGRAHHRVIYFVGRYPGMTVSDLLSILRITKQSLSRVLNKLVDEDYVQQKTGVVDRRQRLLELTDKGKKLERELTKIQRNRIESAFREAGAEAVDGFSKVMMGIIADPVDKERF